jgi:signal transduction histidine kinase/ActR/RegA family two-component response regulator
MVSRFRDLPIRRKLLLISLMSTAAGLVLASSGFLAWDTARFRSELRRDLNAHALVLAENSGAALTFDDEQVAHEILNVLQLQPRVEMACLYTQPQGSVFTSYQRNQGAVCPSQPLESVTLGWRILEIVTPVGVSGRQVGTLYIRRGLGDMYARLRVGAMTVLGLLLVATAAAFLVTARLQQAVVSPLLQLANTARSISSSRDYSLRADVKADGEVGIVVRAFNDMLDRIAEAIEREREANRLKDEFLATLSHELRTPLNAVLGWARILRSGHLDAAAQAQALETIERNARGQARLIEDLLDMSGIVSGRPRLRVRETDLAAVVDAAVEAIGPAAAAKQLRLTLDVNARPALTAGDPWRLQQIVWNLLSNAAKFTPPGGEIRVRLDRENGYRLTVQDTGAGIDPAFQRFVFDRFRQADSSPTREYGGLGLGLAIAKQLVELHGGTIQVHSAGRGHGSTFEVHLPSVVVEQREDVRGNVPSEPAAAMRTDESLLKGVHVLVVDDEEDTRTLLDATLTQFGAQVTTASSVAEALASIDRHAPTVLLSDIAMPEEDGHVLIRRLRTRPASEGGNIPAVAVTAYASVGDGLAAEAAGYQAFVTKPFDPLEVANLVALLGRSSQHAR